MTNSTGFVHRYYRPRWELFVLELTRALLNDEPFDENKFKNDVFIMAEQPFTFRTDVYPWEPTGDQIEVAKEIHAKYRPVTHKLAEFFKALPELSQKGRKFSKYATRWARRFYGLREGRMNWNERRKDNVNMLNYMNDIVKDTKIL